MSKMTQVPLFHRWWGQSAIGLLVAILIPIGIFVVGWTQNPGRSIAIGVCSWVIVMLFQIVHLLRSIHAERLELKQVFEVINENDRLILELQSRLREIATRQLSGKPNQVFIDYCHRSLESSLKVARRAAQRGELEVQDHHFATIEIVLAAFEGCQDRTFRCVWLIEPDENLFDEYWREYMKSIAELSRAPRNQRVRVRILFVFKQQEQLEHRSVKTVLSFVSAEKGFEHHLMLQSDYVSRLRDAELDQQYIDFGVYGDHLLFRTKSYEPNIGMFSDDQTIIGAYRRMHNAAMDATTTLKTPTGLPVNISLEQFLHCDSADAGYETTVEPKVEQ